MFSRIDKFRIDKLKDDLICPVCYKHYKSDSTSKRRPKVLPCGHTLCFTCLCIIIQNRYGEAKCPIDKKRITEDWQTIRSESVIDSKFPTNFLVISLLNETPSLDEPYALCILHKKPLDSLCFTDKALICQTCFETSHLDHKVIPVANIQDLAKQRKKQLEMLLDKSQKEIKEACKVLQERKVNLLQQKTQDKWDTFEKLLNEKLERAQNLIDKECSQKEQVIKTLNLKNIVGIQDQIEGLRFPVQNPQFIEAYENPDILKISHINQEHLEDFYRKLNREIDNEFDQVEIKTGSKPEMAEILMHLTMSHQNDWLIISSKERKSLDRDTGTTIFHLEEARKFHKIDIKFSYPRLSTEFINNLKLFWKNIDNIQTIKFSVLFREFQDEDLLTLCSSPFWPTEKVLSFEINLDSAQITDNSIINGLTGSLQKMVNLKKLKINLKETKISDESLVKLSRRSICSMTHLEEIELDFTGTTITGNGLVQFSYYLKASIQSVKRFKLVLNNTKIEDEGLIGIVDYLLPQFTTLEIFELCLFNACITNLSVTHLSNQMAIFKNSISSLTLALSSNSGITDEGVEALAINALINMHRLKTFKLYLRKTGITDSSMGTLASVLKEVAPNLTTFDLVLSNTKVTDQALEVLSEYVFKNFTSLQDFELSLFETQVTDISLDHICKNMTNNLNNLQKFHLMLSRTNVKDPGATALGTTISQMQNLQSFEFSLRDTKVRDESLIMLSKNMRNLRNLKNLTLMLNNTKITDKGLKELMQNALDRPNDLEAFEINLGFTKVSDCGVSYLCDALIDKAKGIKAFKLHLSHSKVKGKSVPFISKLLQSMDRLEDFELELCQVPLDAETATQLFLTLEDILPILKRMKFNSVSIPVLDGGTKSILEIRKLIFASVDLYTKKYNSKREREEYRHLLMKAQTTFSILPLRVHGRKRKQPKKAEVGDYILPKLGKSSKLSILYPRFATVSDLKRNLRPFLRMDSESQRQILGELLFPLIQPYCPHILAPKVTGMLIDLSVLEVTEVIEFLEDKDRRLKMVAEAIQLIENEGF